MQKITTFLTYDDQAEPAARLYVSIFEDQCRIVDTVKGPNDKVMTVTFDLFGVRHVALNAGPSPDFHFSNGVSLMVLCEDQAEVDRYWAKLTADGGSEIMCGWCKDRFGLPWQIVPRAQMEMIASKDRAAAGRAMQAMMKMKKLDLATLQRAFDGG
jgi:predicted 3-demethylubiquinone-9 3-methyltransferase (glyoxalase superfamily)